MSKYRRLAQFFKAQTAEFLRMTFDEVEQEAGFKLPASARLHQAWWANDRARHVQAKAWLEAGYESEQVDMAGGRLAFRRAPAERPSALGKPGGMSEPARAFQPAAGGGEAKPGRHPLIGSMKGSFWIDPAFDATRSALDADEIAKLFANIERTADLIEAGLRRKSQ
ncbi:MAG TPA: hypothetical protein VHC42_09680 [Rhizomicrobium sp.]|nr:hypothetical protein [Rhizomicrobium sp.]